MLLIRDKSYKLENVMTPSGHCLNKGGAVRLVDVIKRGEVPTADAIKFAYSYEPGTKAFDGVLVAFKEDRLVLERVDPPGKPFVLLEKYTSFLTLDAPEPDNSKSARASADQIVAFLSEIRPGQVWEYPSDSSYPGASPEVRFRIAGIRHGDDGKMVAVTLAHPHTSNGTQSWIDSSGSIDISTFARCCLHHKAVQIVVIRRPLLC